MTVFVFIVFQGLDKMYAETCAYIKHVPHILFREHPILTTTQHTKTQLCH